MKFILLLLDGSADKKQRVNNKSPIEYAKTPVLDKLTQKVKMDWLKQCLRIASG